MKLCILMVDMLEMCMWVFGEARINFDRILACFRLSYFWLLFELRVSSLCNQLLLQFSMSVSQTLQICCGHIRNSHAG